MQWTAVLSLPLRLLVRVDPLGVLLLVPVELDLGHGDMPITRLLPDFENRSLRLLIYCVEVRFG